VDAVRTAVSATLPKPLLSYSRRGGDALWESTFRRLDGYCRERDWAGFDPYDALNSQLLANTPFIKSYSVRLLATQMLKRSPVNLRPLFRIAPTRDPKATALFLMSYAKRAGQGDDASRTLTRRLATRLMELRSPGTSYSCWGYSFPWQGRRQLVPRFSPNLVATVFAANALLDAHALGLGDEYFEAALSAGSYLASELYWSDGPRAAFAYPVPEVRVPVHNASLLGAALLCRLARVAGTSSGVEKALSVARYSAASQRPDGSWPYGLAPHQQWVDNFHTGYNLCALHSIGAELNIHEFDPIVARGFDYYRATFFTTTGVAKYFHDRTYPIDIHSVAQSIITLADLSSLSTHSLDVARDVLSWALEHMWDERGFFYYRVLRGVTIRTSYMRWSQAWMLLALATMLGVKDLPSTGSLLSQE
jgi:hypothetical protein